MALYIIYGQWILCINAFKMKTKIILFYVWSLEIYLPNTCHNGWIIFYYLCSLIKLKSVFLSSYAQTIS